VAGANAPPKSTENKEYFAHLSLRSSNAKTGPIPVSVTTRETCPTTCELRGAGCYAEGGPIALHWDKVTNAERGMTWEMFCEAVSTLPDGQLWRHNAAGDLPGDGTNIDGIALKELIVANEGKRGFTYTHYNMHDWHNRAWVNFANKNGLRVNLSSNNLEHADELYDLGAGPVVTLLPHDAAENVKTPKGRTVVVCPATQRDDVSCATCELCQRERTTIVGFPAHGNRYKTVNIIAKEKL
jgi:hypothetical protein